MEIDALLEAFQDFEKKEEKEACPVLERFLCHVAKTGQSMIPWSKFKAYFMFKLEDVMDDFHASTPEQKRQHNPNVDYVPFDERKERILKIVDAYNGSMLTPVSSISELVSSSDLVRPDPYYSRIPFTIQRLCELLTDPKRNYTGTDKFLMGLEKNVMVVSSVYPIPEKNGASSVNRVNGVMFPDTSSLYSDSQNVNGPGAPNQLNRPKLSSCHLLSTNGFPDCPVSKEPVLEEHHNSDPTPSDGESTPNVGIKNKHSEEEEEEKEDSDGDVHEVKRPKIDKKEEDETEREEKDSPCRERSENLSETSDNSKDSCGHEYGGGASCDTPTILEEREPSRAQTDPSESDKDSSETVDDVHSVETESTVDLPAPSEPSTSSEQEHRQSSSSSSSSSDEGCLPCDEHVPSSSKSPDLPIEGDADDSDSPKTATETGEA